MNKSTGQFDELLFSMLRETKTLPAFLDEIFGFLSRRTDFYVTATERNSPVGLPEGVSERIVRQTYHKWKPQVKVRVPEEEEEEEAACPVPLAIEEVEITEEQNTEVHSQKEPQFFTSSDRYNGAVYGTYCWSQSLLEIEVAIRLPANVTSKNLSVNIQSDKISVKTKDSSATLLEGELCDKCKHNEAIWSVHGQKLAIHLDKTRELWWDCFLKTEPKLEVAKLDCTRPFEDLPEEAQAKIAELQFNQEQKLKGLPTTEDLRAQAVLREAWNVKGSPFSGPFDPSVLQINH